MKQQSSHLRGLNTIDRKKKIQRYKKIKKYYDRFSKFQF